MFSFSGFFFTWVSDFHFFFFQHEKGIMEKWQCQTLNTGANGTCITAAWSYESDEHHFL